MKIDITYNSTVKASNFSGGATEEAAFKSAVNYVVKEYESLFTNPDTINITVGWGTPSHPGDLGHSSSSIENFSYSAIKTALANTAAASGDAAQVATAASLPTKNPFGSSKITITTAEAKALGLLSATATASDGTVNFNSKDTWSFTPGVAPAAGAYYFVGTAEHEFSEVLGRLSSENTSGTGAGLVDLFRYTAPGVRATVPDTTKGSAYFSYDNGATNLGSWNNDVNNGDLSDWWPGGPAPGGNDAFNDYSNSGVINALTTNDVTLLNVLGWDTANAPNDIPSGVTGWVNGTTSAGLNVLAGGYLEGGNGAFAFATTVNNNGSFRVDGGTTAQATHLLAGGTETVFGTDIASEVYGNLYVRGSGAANSESIWSGGYMDVGAKASASNTSVNTGGMLSVEGRRPVPT